MPDVVTLEKPDHIPDELVYDVDIYNLPGLVDGYTDDIHLLWKKLQDTHPPMFWTPRNGGHWFLTRHDIILKTGINAESFSNSDIFVPKGSAPFLTPTNMDPPEHIGFRKLLMPSFAPASLERASDQARAAAIALIEELRPQGSCEFVRDFSSIMPIVAFMTLINLPMIDLAFLKSVGGTFTPGEGGRDGWAKLSAYVQSQIAMRRKNPQDDFISSLLHATANGQPLTEEQIFSMVLLIVAGGLDTVATQMSFVAAFLAENPDYRRRIIAEPAIIDAAIEEMFRRFGVSNIARVATRDCEIDGVAVRKNESVMLIYPLAGLDETKNPDPMIVNFDRKGGRHLLFGSGVHTCIGNRLAKRELRLFLEEWLSRIPDFEIAPGTRPVESTGVTNRLHTLHLVWDPSR
jgi:cytochrome P450